jgi:hypothetical protein
MRRSLLLAVGVALAAAAPARAEPVTLWGCHGPGGAPLPFSYSASGTIETDVTEPGGGCASVGGALRIAFARTDPANGQWASLRFAPPPGLALEHVWLGRRASGPGYWAKTSSTPLETLAGGSLDGSVFAGANGDWVELGLRCSTPDARCDAPDARVDLRFAALTVRDDAPPGFYAEDVPRVAKGTFEVAVNATDSGLGVAQVTAALGGAPVATANAGQGLCRELSPADGTTDFPLSEDCPATDRLVLSIDSAKVADGAQRLDLRVTDAAGNATAKSYDVRVANAPPPPWTSTPPVSPPGGVAVAPPPPPVVVPTTGELTAAKRYKVAGDGTFAVTARCPKAAPSTCSITLKVTAKLPGRRKAATIATARSTARPGKRAKVNLRLSAPGRSALRKKRTLTARLTLEGSAPVSVKLAR